MKSFSRFSQMEILTLLLLGALFPIIHLNAFTPVPANDGLVDEYAITSTVSSSFAAICRDDSGNTNIPVGSTAAISMQQRIRFLTFQNEVQTYLYYTVQDRESTGTGVFSMGIIGLGSSNMFAAPNGVIIQYPGPYSPSQGFSVQTANTPSGILSPFIGDGRYHNFTLSQSYATGIVTLWVDGVLILTETNGLVNPSNPSLGGGGGATFSFAVQNSSPITNSANDAIDVRVDETYVAVGATSQGVEGTSSTPPTLSYNYDKSTIPSDWMDNSHQCGLSRHGISDPAAIGVTTKSATSTSVSCNPTSVAVNQPTACTATVTDSSVAPTSPTGSVTFSSSSSGSFSPSATCTLSPTGSSTSACSVSYTPNPGTEGTQTITGTYSGDSTHQTSMGSFSLTVTKRSTTTSVGCSPTTIQDHHSTTCTATVTDASPGTQITPTGTVSWSSNGPGTFSSTTCTLSGTGGTAACSVTFTSLPGMPSVITITGTYGGDVDHSGSTGSTTIIHR